VRGKRDPHSATTAIYSRSDVMHVLWLPWLSRLLPIQMVQLLLLRLCLQMLQLMQPLWRATMLSLLLLQLTGILDMPFWAATAGRSTQLSCC